MHRFISFEPLHEQLGVHLNQHLSDKLDWLIVGAETGNRKGKITPEPEWIETILNEARGWHIPLFMKINLAPYWPDKLLQDSPNTLIRRSANPATRH
jgi:protein gp37